MMNRPVDNQHDKGLQNMDRTELELEVDNLRLKLESAAEDNAALYRENTVLRGLIDALAGTRLRDRGIRRGK